MSGIPTDNAQEPFMDSVWCLCLFVVIAVGAGVYFVLNSKRDHKTQANPLPATPTSRTSVLPPTTLPSTGPPTATADDLETAETVLRRFGLAVGTTNDALRNAATAIARAGGVGTMEDEIRAAAEDHRRNPATVGERAMDRTQRPWLWLAAVAEQAGQQGHPMLVARICLTAQFWQSVVEEHFSTNAAGIRDLMTIGLHEPFIEQRLAIATAGLTYLRTLPPAQPVPPEATEPVPVSGILLSCAIQIEQAADEGLTIDASIRAAAQEIISGDSPTPSVPPSSSEPSLAQPADAIPVLQQRLTHAEQADGAGHTGTLTPRETLGTAYHAVGRIREATALFEQNLAIRVRQDGIGHPNTATTINNLAMAYHAAGRHSESIALLTDALATSESAIGDAHPDTITARSNLAQAYEATNRPAEAIAMFEQVLADRRRVLGTDHPDTLTAEHNLAHAYQTAGRLNDAITVFEANLTASKRVLGEEHPDTLSSSNALALAYDEAGQPERAVPLLEQNRAARLRVLGPAHVHTITSAMNLASAYLTAGRSADAIALQQEAVADAERFLESDHPTTQIAIANLRFMTEGSGS